MSGPRAPWAGLIRVNALVAVLYAALGAATLLLAQLSGLAAPVWPAAGVALAFALIHGWRVLPGVVVGSFVANAATLSTIDVPTTALVLQASAVAVGAALQAMAGRGLVRRFDPDWASLVTPRQILRFLLLAGPIACLVNPTIGVASQLATGIISGDQIPITWLTWWVGDSIGVIVFAPLTLMFLPELADDWSGRRWKIAVPTVLIVAAFVLAVLQNAGLEEERARLQLERVATEATADLRRNLDRHTEALQGVKGLVVASERLTAAEFSSYTRSALARFPDLQALSWNPAVAGEELDSFIRTQRLQPGFEDFTVTERDAEGNLQPATPRPQHVVVGYIEPIESNRAALGFDIASNPARVEAITRARDTGLPSATSPIELVQDSGSQKGMLALLPVYAGGIDPGDPVARAEALAGFSVGVYKLEDLLADTFEGGTWDDYRIRLIDVTTAGEPVVIADLPSRTSPTVDLASDAVRILSTPFDAYGRAWELEVIPTGVAADGIAPSITPSFLLAGLLLVFLLEAFVLLLTGLERQARREAESSSYEASHDALTGLLNRRALLRQLESLQLAAGGAARRHMLLFLDLDGFKAVNDTGGHEAGDALLVQIADSLRESVRLHDSVARMGGDEFAVVLVDCPSERGMQIADALVRAVEACSIPHEGGQLSAGVSIGAVVLEPSEGLSVDELLRRADTACYEAKRDGTGQVRLHDVELSAGT